MKLAKGTIKRIHVNKHIIVANRKYGRKDPAITLQTSKGSIRTAYANVIGTVEFIQSDDKPLSCGARLWAETKGEVNYI